MPRPPSVVGRYGVRRAGTRCATRSPSRAPCQGVGRCPLPGHHGSGAARLPIGPADGPDPRRSREGYSSGMIGDRRPLAIGNGHRIARGPSPVRRDHSGSLPVQGQVIHQYSAVDLRASARHRSRRVRSTYPFADWVSATLVLAVLFLARISGERFLMSESKLLDMSQTCGRPRLDGEQEGTACSAYSGVALRRLRDGFRLRRTDRRYSLGAVGVRLLSEPGDRPARTNSTIRALNSRAYLRPLPNILTPPR